MKVELNINGSARAVEIAPGERLLDTLRRLNVHEVKRGCEEGTCGACTVLVDGAPMLACLLFTASAAGRALTTVTGLPDDIAQALVEVGGVQCGFCTPGIVLSAHALLCANPAPSEAEIRRALDGNLCRCTGYVKIVEGVQLAAARRSEEVAS